MFTLVTCLGQMARTVGQKMHIFLDEIYPILVDFLKTLK